MQIPLLRSSHRRAIRSRRSQFLSQAPIVCLFLSASTIVVAQPAQVSIVKPSSSLGATLTDVLSTALADHPSVKSRRAELSASQFDLDGAQWNRFPSLTVSAQADQDRNLPNAASDQRVARLEQPIWAGGRISGGISRANAQVSQSEALLLSVQQEVLQQTSALFYEVLRLEARLSSARENTAEHRNLVELIERRVALEASPESDRTVAESRSQLAKSEEIQINRQLESLRLQLNQLVGTVVGPVRRPPPIRSVKFPTEDEAIKVALSFSPQRRASQAQAEASAADIAIAQSRLWPNLVAGYQQTWQTVNGANLTDGQGFIGLQFQPGSGLSSLSTARAAESRRQAAVDGIVAVDRQVIASVSAVLSDIFNFQAQLEPARLTVRGTEEVVDSYLRQYQIGRKGWLDVLNAQREKFQAKSALSDVEYGLEASKIRLLLLTGEVTPSNLQSVHD